MLPARQKVVDTWLPLFKEFVEHDKPHVIHCGDNASARKLRVMYYRARLYVENDSKLNLLYGFGIRSRTAKVIGNDLVFEKHTQPYLEQMMKESLE